MDRNQISLLLTRAENYLRQLAPHVGQREAAQIMRDLVVALKVEHADAVRWRACAARESFPHRADPCTPAGSGMWTIVIGHNAVMFDSADAAADAVVQIGARAHGS